MSKPVPKNPSELEEMLNERDTRLGETMQDYVRQQTEALEPQMKALLQAGMGEWLKENDAPAGTSDVARAVQVAEAAGGRTGSSRKDYYARHKLFWPGALGAQLDGEDYASSIGKFITGVLATKRENSDAVRAFEQRFRNAMSERVPSSGGFLIPEVLRSQILLVALENAVIRPRARIIPMDSLRIPYPTIDDTSHTSSVFGGVQALWTEEGASLTVSQPSFGRIVLEAKKLTAYTTIPNELLQDAITALDQWFNEMFPLAVAFFEDVAFITGSGTGQPQGYQNSPCAIVGPARAGGAGANVQFSDIATMYSRMWPASHNNAVWMCSPDTIPGLIQLSLSSNVAPPLFLQGYQAMGLPGGSDGTGYQYRLMGRPLIISEKMPALNAQGCLAYVDLNYYLLGDRMAMQVANSDEYLFANDLTAFRVIERVDGRTWLQSAITPENGSANTLSPVVLIHA